MTRPSARRERPCRFTWIVPGKVIAMARPSADDFEALRACRVRNVISLTSQPLDDDDLSLYGITALRLPLLDMSAPTAKEIAQFVAALTRLVDSGEKVAVHCGAGLGRTGTMLACWLVSRGKSAEDALREVRRRRPGSVESDQQEDAVREYEARLRTPPPRRPQ